MMDKWPCKVPWVSKFSCVTAQSSSNPKTNLSSTAHHEHQLRAQRSLHRRHKADRLTSYYIRITHHTQKKQTKIPYIYCYFAALQLLLQHATNFFNVRRLFLTINVFCLCSTCKSYTAECCTVWMVLDLRPMDLRPTDLEWCWTNGQWTYGQLILNGVGLTANGLTANWSWMVLDLRPMDLRPTDLGFDS